MANNAQKTPVVRTLNDFARKKAADAIQLLGKALPASVVSVTGQIVTVKFELDTTFTLPQVQVPVATSFYRREPIQAGDLGVVRPADVPLGGISGLGKGTATLTTPANLAALVWEPVANLNWDASPDANAYLIQGPNGFIVRDTGNNCSIVGDKNQITITGKTQIKLVVGSNSITLSSSGIDLEGTLTINGKAYLSHEHSGVQTGGGNSGPVVP